MDIYIVNAVIYRMDGLGFYYRIGVSDPLFVFSSEEEALLEIDELIKEDISIRARKEKIIDMLSSSIIHSDRSEIILFCGLTGVPEDDIYYGSHRLERFFEMATDEFLVNMAKLRLRLYTITRLVLKNEDNIVSN